jgi:hypothetical protein
MLFMPKCIVPSEIRIPSAADLLRQYVTITAEIEKGNIFEKFAFSILRNISIGFYL